MKDMNSPDLFPLETKYVLKPSGGTETGKAIQNLGFAAGNVPK
jgi:hypothetical protein